MHRRPLKLNDYIKEFTQEAANKLSPYIISGKYNIEFIRGNQNKYIDRKLEIVDKPNSGSVYTEKKIFNRLLSIYLTRFGILSKNMPIPGFKPQDNSAKRQFDAVRGNDFIKNFLVDSNFKDDYNNLIKQADVYGLCWLKTGIDWSGGESIETISTTAKTGDESATMEYTLKEGRPFIEVVPIYEVFPDNLHAENMSQINELVHRRVFSCSYIKRKWGITVEPEKIDSVSLASTPQYNDLAFMTSDAAEYAYVYEYYKRPDAVYPEGRYVLMVRDNIIYDGKLPYVNNCDKREIPFDMVSLQNLPDYTVGVTVYSQIIPIQETYNAIKNRYLEYVNHIAIGQLYYFEGSLVNPKTFTTKPGRLIALKRNSRPPVPVQKDKLSMEFIQYLKTLEEDMLVTAGLSQLTAFGSSKSNVRTDGVVDKIDESDQNKLVNAVENVSSAIIKAFKKLMYCENYRTKVLTEKLNIAKIDDYAVKYRLDNVDIEQLSIVNRDFLIQDDRTMDKKLSQAISIGLYDPNRNLSYLSKIHLTDALQCNYLMDTLDPSEKAQHDLIESEHFEFLEKNTEPPVEKYYIHSQHILEHNIFRISPEVRMLKEQDPDRYEVLMQMLDNHISQHEKYEAERTQPNQVDSAKAVFGNTARR